jgi:hypothetical protein
VQRLLPRIQVYDLLLARRVPTVYERFKQLDISPQYYLIDWILTLFTRALPLSTALRLWDCFFLEGEMFVYRAAVGIMKKLQPHIEGADFEQILKLLHTHPSTIPEAELMLSIYSIRIPRYIKNATERLHAAELEAEAKEQI